MILVRRGAGVDSDEHFATLNGAANGLFFAVSENLENILSFSAKNDTNRLIESSSLSRGSNLVRFPR